MIGTKHYNIRIHGQVQGVFFRASARSHAEALGLMGFAQNETDGSVYIEAEGEEELLRLFVEWCHRGPDRAHVYKVEVSEDSLKNFSAFTVNRGSFQ